MLSVHLWSCFLKKILFISELLLEHISDVFYTLHFDFTTGNSLLVGGRTGIQMWLSLYIYIYIYLLTSALFRSGIHLMKWLGSHIHHEYRRKHLRGERGMYMSSAYLDPVFIYVIDLLIDNLLLFLSFNLSIWEIRIIFTSSPHAAISDISKQCLGPNIQIKTPENFVAWVRFI